MTGNILQFIFGMLIALMNLYIYISLNWITTQFRLVYNDWRAKRFYGKISESHLALLVVGTGTRAMLLTNFSFSLRFLYR